MGARGSLSILVVIYDRELPQALFLLQSIERMFDLEGLHQLYLVIQEEGSQLSEAITQIVRTRFSDLQSRSVIVSQDAIAGRPLRNHGWFIQQFLKLKVSSLAGSDYVLVLDCKNHFVNATTAADFFVEGLPVHRSANEAHRFQPDADPFMGKLLVNSYQAFGLDPMQYLSQSLGMLTPFVVRTCLVAELIHELEASFRRDFCDLFLNHLQASEFFLYTAYLHARGLVELETRRLKPWLLSSLIYAGNCRNPQELSTLLAQISTGQLKVFGVHKLAYGRVDPPSLRQLESLWRCRGLDAGGCGYLDLLSAVPS